MTTEERARAFFELGWTALPPDPAMANWAAAARGPALALAAEPDAEFRCDGAWFPGVNALANEAQGAAPQLGIPPLAGGAVDFVAEALGFRDVAWDQAQISICYPGYPRHGSEETEAAFRYRVNREAAHVDGLLREPPRRRRRLGETHAFILAAPLAGVEAPGASAMVVWEGSHKAMRAAFRTAFDGVSPDRWRDVDVTEIYQETRRRCFDTCRRVVVGAPVGGAYLVHRLALHGVSAWTAPSDAPPRAIAYFRPDPFPNATDPRWWLETP